MPAVLLDANVLSALVVEEHVHHGQAEAWFVASGTGFATCPMTQGSLMRLLIREGQTAEAARSALQEITPNPRHEFWPDNRRPDSKQLTRRKPSATDDGQLDLRSGGHAELPSGGQLDYLV